jgi:hypothetical protein
MKAPRNSLISQQSPRLAKAKVAGSKPVSRSRLLKG